jgi:hypothetical protein
MRRHYENPARTCISALALLGRFYGRITEEHTDISDSDLLNHHPVLHENAEEGEHFVREETGQAYQACIRAKMKCEVERPYRVRLVLPFDKRLKVRLLGLTQPHLCGKSHSSADKTEASLA